MTTAIPILRLSTKKLFRENWILATNYLRVGGLQVGSLSFAIDISLDTNFLYYSKYGPRGQEEFFLFIEKTYFRKSRPVDIPKDHVTRCMRMRRHQAWY